MSREPEHDVADSATAPDDDFMVEPLTTSHNRLRELWDCMYARRVPSQRTVFFSLGVGLLVLAVLLGSTEQAAMLWTRMKFAILLDHAPTLIQTTLAPVAPRTQQGGGWERLTLPAASNHVSWYAVRADNPTALVACGGPSFPPDESSHDTPLTLWHSEDTGQHWQTAVAPKMSGVFCVGSVAPDAPQNMAVMVYSTAGCGHTSVALTHDGGRSWARIPTVPAPPVHMAYCTGTVWLTAHHLFLFGNNYRADTGSASHGQNAAPQSTLARSDDDGRTWRQLDAGLPPDSTGLPPTQLADGKSLLLAVPYYVPAKGQSPSSASQPLQTGTHLWVSHDAGDSWTPLGTLGDYVAGLAGIAVPAQSGTPTVEHPVYVLSNTSIPHSLLRIQVAELIDASHWALLLPLPVGGSSVERTGITAILTTTPAGHLLVFGVGPNDTLSAASAPPATDSEQQWLWDWDPRAARWTSIIPALPQSWRICSDHCWQASTASAEGSGGSNTYLDVRGGVNNSFTEAFRMLLPPGM